MTEQPPLVAHIIYHLGIGGLENGLVNLINSIPTSRYRHVIICLTGHSDFAARISRDDVRLFDLSKRPGKDIGSYFRLFRLLRQLRPQIVHTRNFGTLDCQFVAALAGIDHRIHGEHGWDVGDLHGTLTKTVIIRRTARAVVHQYTTVSNHMANWLKNVIKIRSANVTQIYNGIDALKFSPGPENASATHLHEVGPSEGLVVGTVGRLDPVKDQLTLLRALESVIRRAGPEERNIRLVIVGDGQMRKELTQFVNERKLGSYVKLVGASNNVAELMREFDVFALPSLNEGISNTILEAMATGLPVIASSAGGNPELVVDGVTGALFKAGDSESLADLMCTYYDNPNTRRTHGAAGRTRAIEEFSMDAMVESYVRVYDQGLKNINKKLGTTTG